MKRKAFLSAAAVAAASQAAAASASVPGGAHFVERKADFDETAFARAAGRPADIRQVIEAVAFHPALLNNVKNALNGFQFGFGIRPQRVSVVVAAHGPSSAYNYTDEIWGKYHIGDALNLRDGAGNRVSSNIYYPQPKGLRQTSDPDAEDGPYQDSSIQTLTTFRNVLFLTCHTAVEEQARTLVKGGFAPSGMSASDVADDILTHLIPGTMVVPSMLSAIGMLQHKYNYAYVTLTFA